MKRSTLAALAILLSSPLFSSVLNADELAPPKPPKGLDEIDDQDPRPVCPTSSAEWSEWREKILRDSDDPDILAEKVLAAEKCNGVSLSKAMKKDPALKKCMTPLAETAKALDTRVMNSEMLDQYFQPEKLDYPDMMKLPDIFRDEKLRKVLTRKDSTQQEINEQMARIQKRFPEARMVQFSSRFVCGDTFIVTIPNQNYDRWFHFEKDGPDCAEATNRISLPTGTVIVAAVQKREPSGKTLETPRSFFNVFVEEGAVAKGKELEPLRGAHEVSAVRHFGGTQLNCFQCHRTGPVSLIPDPRKPVISHSPGSTGMQIVKEMNSRIGSMSNALPAGFPIQSKLGPPIGEVDPPSRTDEFMANCTGYLPPDGVARVKSAMNCAMCHNDSTAGAFRYPMGTHKAEPIDILQEFIRSGHMPPHNKLSLNERNVLVTCLMQEYYGGFKDATLGGAKERGRFLSSLGEISCETGESSRRPSGHGAARNAKQSHLR